MKFRKLYWVTEQIDNDGKSEVIGVYTSHFDLIDKGLKWHDSSSRTAAFRISLVKLDSSQMPFGVWVGPNFDGMEDDLKQFIDSGEFEEHAMTEMIANLRKFGNSS